MDLIEKRFRLRASHSQVSSTTTVKKRGLFFPSLVLYEREREREIEGRERNKSAYFLPGELNVINSNHKAPGEIHGVQETLRG